MEGGVISLPVPAPAPVSCLANREFQATPTPSPPDESTVLRELNVSVSLAGLDISRGHHGEPDVLGQRRSKCKPKVRTVSKMHMVAKAKARAEKAAAAAVDKAKAEKAAALDKAKSEKKVAADKAKAEKAARAANDKAKTEKKQAAADDKAKAEKKAAPAGGAASPDLLRLDLYLVDGYGIKEQRMVKMDHRNSYIKWLLEWDKKPRRPLPNLPMAPKSMAAIKAQRDHDERVLADFKRNGYAYVQVDVFNDDDPRANLPDHHYDIIHHDSHEVA